MTEKTIYTYAFLDAESNVIATALFASQDDDLVNQTKEVFGADSVKSCEQYGECGAGSYFYNDVFYPPKPYNSWIIDEANTSWKAPIQYPIDGKTYKWNEENTLWELFIPDSPFESWTWSEDIWAWLAPIPYPAVEEGSDEIYTWDENTTSWLLLPPSN
jgi:hypothetical protein